jgi:hypothetical protein
MDTDKEEIDSELLIKKLEEDYELKLKMYNIARCELKTAQSALNLSTKKIENELFLEKLISDNYRRPTAEEIPAYIQPSKMLKDLCRAKKLYLKKDDVIAKEFGYTLKRLGFKRVMKRINRVPRYCYQVIQLY